MSDRYFSSALITGSSTILDGPEAHHLIHVMRAKPGQQVTLFDGSGAEFLARVEKLGRTDVRLAVVERIEVDRELPTTLVLGAALPKGDRQRWLVEKAVELGVAGLVPLVTERAVARPGDGTLARLSRTVIEASKQCGRNRLMQIGRPQAWERFVETDRAAARLLAHPVEGPTRAAFPRLQVPTSDKVLLAVGPEGGFTQGEVELADSAGWQPIDLGPRVLRIETAAVYLVAMVVQSLCQLQ